LLSGVLKGKFFYERLETKFWVDYFPTAKNKCMEKIDGEGPHDVDVVPRL
jgi:hypothetical protein